MIKCYSFCTCVQNGQTGGVVQEPRYRCGICALQFNKESECTSHMLLHAVSSANTTSTSNAQGKCHFILFVQWMCLKFSVNRPLFNFIGAYTTLFELYAETGQAILFLSFFLQFVQNKLKLNLKPSVGQFGGSSRSL